MYDPTQQEETYETESVYVWVRRCVLDDIPAGHPIRNELEGFGENASEGDDVWVCQVFPLCHFFAKVLLSVS
jgi:hypothetical protein